jgi:hypothetical protein
MCVLAWVILWHSAPAIAAPGGSCDMCQVMLCCMVATEAWGVAGTGL